MKRTWIVGVAVVFAVPLGCDEEALRPNRTSASPSTTTVATTAAAPKTVTPTYADGTSAKSCADYVAAMERCLATMPPSERGPLERQLTKQREALGKASEPEKRAMAPGCRMGLESLKQSSSCAAAR